MKGIRKLFCTLLALLLVAGLAFALADAEDKYAVDGEELVLLDQDGVKVYLTGDYQENPGGDDSVYIYLNSVVENNSDQTVCIEYTGVVNGWNLDSHYVMSGATNVPSGTKSKTDIWFSSDKVEAKSFAEVETMRLTFFVKNGDYQDMFEADTGTVHFHSDAAADEAAPAEEAPAEDAAAPEEAPAEETPAEEPAAEEAPAEEAAIDTEGSVGVEIHSGVKLGMSKEAVRALEEKAGYKVGDPDSDSVVADFWDKQKNALQLKETEEYRNWKPIYTYVFDSDDRLIACGLRNTLITGDKSTRDWLMTNLEAVLGEPVAEGDKCFDLGDTPHAMDDWENERKENGSHVKKLDNYQWIAPLEGEYLDVQLVDIQMTTDLRSLGYGKIVSRNFHISYSLQPMKQLEKGSKGGDVKLMQQKLIELDYLDGSADGIFGSGTAGGVEAFQSANGLEATGVADLATLSAIFAK